jgi:hypothetical protein
MPKIKIGRESFLQIKTIIWHFFKVVIFFSLLVDSYCPIIWRFFKVGIFFLCWSTLIVQSFGAFSKSSHLALFQSGYFDFGHVFFALHYCPCGQKYHVIEERMHVVALLAMRTVSENQGGKIHVKLGQEGC